MTVKDLYERLNLAFPPSLSLDWDRDGLMVCPDPGRRVRRVLVTLDVTPAAADAAIQAGADLILSHHPLLFHPLATLSYEDPGARTALTLADLKGQRTILYFYPKDNTSGCTLEAKSLRDGRAELARMGFRIIGVSPDSEKSHRNFCAKHDLNFTLLADTDHSVCEAYGVWAEKSMYGRKYMGVLRTTFVIDAEGRIEKVFTKVDTANHYRQILDAYK